MKLYWLSIVKVQLLAQECQALICKTNFVSILCFAIENQEQHQKVLD